MAVQLKTKITDEEFLALGPDVNAEVIDGEIVTRAASNLDHSVFGQQLASFLLIATFSLAAIFCPVSWFPSAPCLT